MDGEVKILEARVAVLERRVAELMAKMGIDAAALDAYEYKEAMDHLARTGDPSLLKEHLKKVNSRKTA